MPLFKRGWLASVRPDVYERRRTAYAGEKTTVPLGAACVHDGSVTAMASERTSSGIQRTCRGGPPPESIRPIAKRDGRKKTLPRPGANQRLALRGRDARAGLGGRAFARKGGASTGIWTQARSARRRRDARKRILLMAGATRAQASARRLPAWRLLAPACRPWLWGASCRHT